MSLINHSPFPVSGGSQLFECWKSPAAGRRSGPRLQRWPRARTQGSWRGSQAPRMPLLCTPRPQEVSAPTGSSGSSQEGSGSPLLRDQPAEMPGSLRQGVPARTSTGWCGEARRMRARTPPGQRRRRTPEPGGCDGQQPAPPCWRPTCTPWPAGAGRPPSCSTVTAAPGIGPEKVTDYQITEAARQAIRQPAAGGTEA